MEIYGSVKLRGSLADGTGDPLLTKDETTSEVGTAANALGTLAEANIFVGNASSVPTGVAVSGDISIDSTGLTAISSGVVVNADINATAAISVSKLAALTASRAVVTDASGFISASSVTSTVLGYIANLSSDAQTQISAKQATITGGATTITSSDLTANRALLSNASGKVAVSSVTNTELGYLSGVTSAIQTQFSGKLSATISGAATGDIIYYNGTNWVNLPKGTDGQTLRSSSTTILWDTPTINGIPVGGITGQVLSKTSGTDFDADWSTLTVSSITDLTASATELNLLDGVTASTTEINYLDGVTSNIQSQLGNKLSSTLAHNAMFIGNASNEASSLAAGSEGQVLTVTSGVPTWQTVSVSGVTTIAALDGTTKSTNGGAISSANLYLQTADATYPGLVSTGTQTFAGAKTFTSPIDVKATATSAIHLRGNAAEASNQWSIKLRNIAEGDFGFYDETAVAYRMYFNSSGNVGIGTTTPTAKLHLPAGTATASTAPLKLTTGTALTTPEDGALEYHSSHLYFTVSSTRYQLDGLIGSTGSTDNAILRADGTGGLTAQGSSASISDTADLTLGTASLAGTERTITATGSASDVALSYISKGTGSHVFRNVGNLSSVVIYPDPTGTGSNSTIHAFGGTLTIGTTSAANALIFEASNTTLSSAGNLAIDGTGTGVDWVATSDRRLKSNIQRVEGDVLEEIKKIGPLFSQYERSGKTERGFIAQELLEIAPEYVTVPEDPEQMMAVNYAKMTALLFKGFQQLLDGAGK